ncbi:SAM-dependent methyltransferase [Kitasatospora sp. NPDC101183]|uniref:SAM-dependent methyltransferase n=1 Tax=Kitasatospora sp. NPDC101183 TaxID=3364100 RepID=UPI003830A954
MAIEHRSRLGRPADRTTLYTRIDGPSLNPYRAKVVDTYDDPPELWRKALGDTLLFQWGLYEGSSRALSLGEAGVRYFDRQLGLAELLSERRPRIRRILDLGCGWGFVSFLLARRFPECPQIDAINISPRQLDYCAEFLADHELLDRVRLFLCDGQDIGLLPDPQQPYDLVIVRGVYTHFPNEVFENAVRALSSRVGPGGTVIISDTLYHGDLGSYSSEVPDLVDRVACANRKTPEYFAEVLEGNGFAIQDMRILPSNAEVAHWFQQTRSNIEANFPEGGPGTLGELQNMAENMAVSLPKDKLSAYSVIARRTAAS